MYTYCKKIGNRIFVREHTDNDGRIISKFDCDVFFPADSNNTEYKTIYGQPLWKKTYPTVKEASKAIEDCKKTMTLYGAKTFGYQYIRDIYRHHDPITHADLKIMNIDIETGRDGFGFSSAEDARCPVTSIAIHQINEDRFIVWGYKDGGYKPKQDNVTYVNCRDEREMLSRYITYFSLNRPHILTGWNCKIYDIPYIINRMKKLNFEEKKINSMSPFGLIFAGKDNSSYYRVHQTYDIVGVSLLDYMILFKQFTYKTPENYKLDTIAHMILGDRKLDYSEYANLQDLYDRNYEKFIDYNIKDVDIVSRLDKKLGLFSLVLMLAYRAGINYVDTISPVVTWDLLIYNAIMNKGMVPLIDIPEAENSQYVGAFVKEPVPGFYRWVVSVDLNSLYPHLQMGLNISPEKRIPDNKLPKELYSIREQLGNAVNGIEVLLNESIDNSPLKQYNVTLTPNGQFYSRDGDGIIPEILEGLYAERKVVKRSMLEDQQELEELRESLVRDQQMLDKLMVQNDRLQSGDFRD